MTAVEQTIRHLLDRTFDDIPLEVGFHAAHFPSGRTIDVNGDALFPTASVFKVAVMAEVFRQAQAGHFALSDRIRLSDDAKTLTTGVLLAFDAGLEPTIRDLTEIMNIVSDNTATTILVDLVGRDNINALMRGLKCPEINVTLNTHEMFLHAWRQPLDRFVGLEELDRATALAPMDYDSVTFERSDRNTVATAAATVRLFAALAAGQVVDAAASRAMVDILRRSQFTGRVTKYLPWNATANKTGTLSGLRNDAGILWRAADDYIVYCIYSFDATPLPIGNSELRTRRDEAVGEMMGQVGLALWNEFARMGAADDTVIAEVAA